MHVVGSLDKAKITGSLAGINKKWSSKKVDIPVYKTPAPPTKSQVYFYDVPDAKQSVLRFGYPALAVTDADFYPANVMNYILGGGGFASQLTQQLREGKGYTYGISSGFGGSKSAGPFTIASGVRSNVTLESAQLVKQILQDYPKNFSDNDLATTKSFLIKSNARAFETAGAKLGMLENISKYGWKYDYVKGREKIVNDMTVARIKELSQKYLDTNKMIWLVVGDAKTQLPRLKELGFGDPILIQK
jgi:zinc protease